MSRAKVRIEFAPDSNQPVVFEKETELGNLREDGGREFVAQHLFSELGIGADIEKYYLALPSVDDFLQPVKQTFRAEEMFTGEYEDRINTREMWWEVGNTLVRAKHLLARSRAYYDQELAHSSSQDAEAGSLSWHFHLDKLDRFELAISALGKVSDLAARLIFDRLGASLVDRSRPNWERDVTLGNIRKGFADRAGNPHVAALTDAEYSTIPEILDDFQQTDSGIRLWAYRVKFVHRIRPSVDRPELYIRLESRERTPIVDATGRTKGWTMSIGGRSTNVEYAFIDLYADAVQVLRHYISMLEQLKAIRRFSPEAVASAATG